MYFKPLIESWGIGDIAKALELPAKNVRRWVDSDSIPAEWFAPLARAAERHGKPGFSVHDLALLAERRRVERSGSPEASVATPA